MGDDVMNGDLTSEGGLHPEPGDAGALSPAREQCPMCGSLQLEERRCKVICRNCRTILQSCADL